MKTKHFLFFLLFITTFNSFSQKVWAPIGAVWHFDINNMGETGYLKIESQKDTIIDGKNCKILHSTKTTFAIPGVYQNQNLESLITYQNNNNIYISA
jgi:hypothetical protein